MHWESGRMLDQECIHQALNIQRCSNDLLSGEYVKVHQNSVLNFVLVATLPK